MLRYTAISRFLSLLILSMSMGAESAQGEDLTLTLRSQRETGFNTGQFRTVSRDLSWDPKATAIVVCDVWDLHHCLNAVRRLEEFAPRLNEVLKAARKLGLTVIHSPSDCMPYYQNHPARKRASATPAARRPPDDVASWCSLIPAEERGTWPIDQSDGGEDDDPAEHADWVLKLKSMGRNPATPWKKQSVLVEIDPDVDYISDRGDEVWNVLEARGIKHVILTGVHTNMCVIGRPFGLRQMARNGKQVVLMRDMTDTMYNPQRWPYVSHDTGTKLIVAHIERYVCPTITSDQILGGEPFSFQGEQEEPQTEFAKKYLSGWSPEVKVGPEAKRHWVPTEVPQHGDMLPGLRTAWYRCVIRVPSDWSKGLPLQLQLGAEPEQISAWFNGVPFSASGTTGKLSIEPEHIQADDANLLVLRVHGANPRLRTAPALQAAGGVLDLEGRWQLRCDDDPSHSNMPLPAKFGSPSDIVFRPEERLWQARPVTPPGEFTSGIEGPACDLKGDLFAVNFARQGTVGRIGAAGESEVFVELPPGSVGNGIRFHESGEYFFVADYTQHNVLKVDVKTRAVSTLAHNDEMNQPNDLAIAPDGTLYASDPDWKSGSGQLWRVDSDGAITRIAQGMGTTNGIEVSPDGKKLYVNESVQRNIWVFEITQDRVLANKRLLKTFPDHGFDGMRCDLDGNLYVTRYGKGTVVKLTPQGEVLNEIDVLGSRPSNLAFGGPDGRTVYVTEVDFARIVRFRVDRPGRAWTQWAID